MFKKLLACVVSASVVCSAFSPAVTFAAKSDTKIAVNEVFDDYPLNDTSEFTSNVNVSAGVDTHVTTRSGSDKAFYTRLWGAGVKIAFPLSTCYDKTVFSFDMMHDGDPILGSLGSLKGTNPPLRLDASNIIKLDNDKKIFTHKSGSWHNYTLAVDFVSGTYSLWIDSKCKFENRYLYDAPKKIEELAFNFNPADESGDSGLYLDNVRVYEGTKPLSASRFPKKAPSSEVLEFEASTEQKVYDEVFINAKGKSGISMAIYPKDGNIAQWETLNGEEVLHFHKKEKTDPYADITTGLGQSVTSFVYQVDFMPIKGTVTTNIATLTGGDANCQIAKHYPTLDAFLAGGENTVGKIPKNEWSNLAVAVNLVTNTCDAYINRELIRADIPLHSSPGVAPRIRIGYPSSDKAGDDECYYKNFKLYEGTKLREFEEDTSETDDSQNSVQTEDNSYAPEVNFQTILDTEDKIKALLGSDVVFLETNSKCYIKKQKRDYSEFGCEPFTNASSVLMVPAKLISEAFSLELVENGNEVTLGGKYIFADGSDVCKANEKEIKLDAKSIIKDGVFFVAAESFAHDVLKKYTYHDHRGYLLISDENRNYSDNESESYNPSDKIQRYMHYDRPSPDKVYNDLKNGGYFKTHPRLLGSREDFLALRAKIPTNKEYTDAYASLIKFCEAAITQPLTKYEKGDGLRLYGALATTAGGMINRLGIAYQLTDDTKYAERAWQELENILNWPDWNLDAHHLDSGAGVPSIVAGYDMIYNYLTPERKEFFKQKFQEMYLNYAVGVFTGSSKFNIDDSRMRYSNWGAVCSEGLLNGALALIDEEDENSLLTQKCKFVLSQAIQGYEYPFGMIFPSGTTDEGVVYWDYHFSSYTKTIDKLRRLCGSDYGMFESPGYTEAIKFFLYTQDANGVWTYNYTTKDQANYFPETTFLYAKMTEDEAIGDALYAFKTILQRSSGIFYSLWHNIRPLKEMTYPLDYYSGKGENLTVMKSSWTSRDAIFLGVVGGTNAYGSQSDKGAFDIRALGEKWLLDYGHESYQATYKGKSIWDRETQIRMYVDRTEGHNCVVINPDAKDYGQEMGKTAEVTRFESNDRGAISVYDLTEVYGNKTTKYERGFFMTDEREAVVVQDEISLSEKSDVYWFANTDAQIAIDSDQKGATLKKNGKQMRVEIYTNLKNYKLESRAAEPFDDDTRIDGELSRESIRKLTIAAEGVSGDIVITAKFIPVDESTEAQPLTYQPIKEWKLPEGVYIKPELSSVKVNGVPVSDFIASNKKYVIDIPYGSPVPVFEATSDTGTVTIRQPQSLLDDAEITVTNAEGKKAIYKFTFNLEIAVTNNMTGAMPEVGLPSGADVLKVQAAYASHEPQANHLAPCAVDDDFTTSWTSDKDGEYIEIDLGSEQSFDGIATAFLTGKPRIYEYEILISSDKQNYTRVFMGKSTGKTAEYESLAIPATARYIRLVGHFNNESSWNNVAELGVYRK